MSFKSTHCVCSLLLGSLIAQATSAFAAIEFPAPSPFSKVEQKVGLTTVTVEYSRPGVKGREVFGGLVPYGEMWRTGANSATKITFDQDVIFGGETVAAGSYGLFTIPGEQSWEVILSSETKLWGANGYDKSDDAARVSVRSIKLSQPVESFTIGFDLLRDDSAILFLDWENTRVPVELKTTDEARILATVADEMPPVDEANAGLLFNSARYFHEHGGDLKKALVWAEAACSKRPEAHYMALVKAKIEKDLGKKKAAKATAEKALEMARDKGDSGMVFQFEQLLESL